MSTRNLRLAGLGLAGALAVVPLTSASALAASPHGHAHARTAHHANKGKRPSRFTATGTITAIDVTNNTVTLADKGGSRDLHGTSVTITVSATSVVTRNDAVASLSDLQAGDHVAVNGTRQPGPVYMARHVNAEAPQSDTTG